MVTAPPPDVLQAEYLTEVLRRAGVLGDGRVRDVAVDPANLTVLSSIMRLQLTYENDAPDAPVSLILKTGHPDRRGANLNGVRKEITFYTWIAPRMATARVPRCFDSRLDEDSQTWHLLLEDLSRTHDTPKEWPMPPTREICEKIVAAHARRQAECWDHPDLDAFMETWRGRDAATGRAYLDQLAAEIARFAERLGDRLPPERRHLYACLIDAGPRLFARYHARRDLTIVQGDSHVWNCFPPRDGGDDVRFFDWDSWRVDVGASDLAYMMAVHWYPDRRRRIERHLLAHYHATLCAHGVREYDRQALDEDYRFAVLWLIAWPVWQQAYGVPPVIWWNNLERVMLAVDDLDCAKLLS